MCGKAASSLGHGSSPWLGLGSAGDWRRSAGPLRQGDEAVWMLRAPSESFNGFLPLRFPL